MRKWFTAIVIAEIFLLLTAACGKSGVSGDDGSDSGPHIVNTQDTIPPVIELLTPVTNQVFNPGDMVSVTGKVTDGDGLYQGSIRITNDANNNILKEQLYVIHGITQYDFSVSQALSVTAVTNCTVTVVFEDHGLNTVTKSVKIKINP
jgi:hypothetical protein